MDRWDETWHRLLVWTNGQGPAERLAAQVLAAEGFTAIDPSHPLGGPDSGKDALINRDGEPWIMAVYFPRDQQTFTDIRTKFLADHEGVAKNDARGMAFVTNQELRLDERRQLQEAVSTPVEIFHLERVTGVLDRPEMHPVREQFLRIPAGAPVDVAERTPREILDDAVAPPGAPNHRSVYDGVLLLRVVAVPATGGTRHPAAADPRAVLAEASRSAATITASWPADVSLVARRLAESWMPMSPHRWGAGRTSADADALARYPSAAASFDVKRAVLCVERTWPTRILNDHGEFAFYAAREPEVVAEILVALRLAGALLAPIQSVAAVDVAVQLAAAPIGTTLVSSERAVSGGRFGEPAGYLENPVAEVASHYLDSSRFAPEELLEPYEIATTLMGPWLATFRDDDLLTRLHEG